MHGQNHIKNDKAFIVLFLAEIQDVPYSFILPWIRISIAISLASLFSLVTL